MKGQDFHYFDIHNPIEEEVALENIEQLVIPNDRLEYRKDTEHPDRTH